MTSSSVPPSSLPSSVTARDRGGVFDPAGIVWTPVSPALASVRRVRLLLVAAVVAIVVVAVALVFSVPVVLLALVVPAVAAVAGWVVIGRQVRAYGYAERAEDLLIRHGLMFRALVVVPYGRMQFVDVQAGPLDRAFKVAQVQLYTASAGSDARIPGVSDDEAARLRDRLSSRGQARLAGL
jgi:membrane protein YdbS with pleckstrin-like domain